MSIRLVIEKSNAIWAVKLSNASTMLVVRSATTQIQKSSRATVAARHYDRESIRLLTICQRIITRTVEIAM